MPSPVLRPRASMDIESITVHISVVLGMPGAAKKTIAAIYETICRVSRLPESGQVVPVGRLEDKAYRRVLVEQYWIYYTYTADNLVVWRVLHTSKDITNYGFEVFEG